jgi:NADH:ubiquinone oxidoreductase subunit 4 (subunit M)
MLWYGYIYYTFFNILLLSLLLIVLRIYTLQSLIRINITLFVVKYLLTLVVTLLLLMLIVLNTSLMYYNELFYINTNFINNITYVGTLTNNLTSFSTSLNLNLVYVYYYPFIYVFSFITILSIVICLAYNTDEVIIFTGYCTVILTTGYTLFFTDSLILFFMAYEMLLVPSNTILYKFAKTRRCVEAAYLMFFGTQFGALFLIFAFIYIFIITNASTFSIISSLYFSSFEVNFIFICCFIGFGVKLPL